MDAPNPHITRHLDSIASLASMLEAAAQVGFRDVTVTTMRRRDGDRAYTYYVLDLAERVEMRGDALPFPDSPITFEDYNGKHDRGAASGGGISVDEFVDQQASLADEEDRKRADHIAQCDTTHGAPRR